MLKRRSVARSFGFCKPCGNHSRGACRNGSPAKGDGEGKGIVMDGRDIGTVVFPLAELKIFMTATPEIRAHRRYDELKSRGVDASYSDILNNVVERDYIDRNRDESPLMRADDALILDNSYLGQTEQLNWALEQVNRVLNDHRNR
jgi:cytidylate kinase